MYWVTSDTHFNHPLCATLRHFSDIAEMNETLIANWNSVVKEEDTVFHLGDFFMGHFEFIKDILPRLNGKIVLVKGNHDYGHRLLEFEKYGVEIHLDQLTFFYDNKCFVMSHQPPEEIKPDIIYLYGHLHADARKGFIDNTYHIGTDTNNFTPVALDQIIFEATTKSLCRACVYPSSCPVCFENSEVKKCGSFICNLEKLK